MHGLIGHTGFVGSNLLIQGEYNACFNSTNFRELHGQHFEQLVCAGVYAVKWKANQHPEQDRTSIKALEDVLQHVKANQFILISTVDVYPSLSNVDENTSLDNSENHTYGRNRLDFENFCKNHFTNCHIVRLPALFGLGLKKNVIYDLINSNCLDMINPSSSFQYYDLSRLQTDLEKIIKYNIPLMNLVTEPIPTTRIVEHFFPTLCIGQKAGPEVHYNVKTCNDRLWEGHQGYIMSAAEILQRLQRFIENSSVMS